MKESQLHVTRRTDSHTALPGKNRDGRLDMTERLMIPCEGVESLLRERLDSRGHDMT